MSTENNYIYSLDTYITPTPVSGLYILTVIMSTKGEVSSIDRYVAISGGVNASVEIAGYLTEQVNISAKILIAQTDNIKNPMVGK